MKSTQTHTHTQPVSYSWSPGSRNNPKTVNDSVKMRRNLSSLPMILSQLIAVGVLTSDAPFPSQAGTPSDGPQVETNAAAGNVSFNVTSATQVTKASSSKSCSKRGASFGSQNKSVSSTTNAAKITTHIHTSKER